MKSNVENKKEKKQNGLFISWVDLILYFIISCLLAFVCILDTVSTIEELKEKYAGINGYIIYGLWFDILWYILIIHYFYGYLFEIIKLIKENRKNKLVEWTISSFSNNKISFIIMLFKFFLYII